MISHYRLLVHFGQWTAVVFGGGVEGEGEAEMSRWLWYIYIHVQCTWLILQQRVSMIKDQLIILNYTN